jgi:hypothetical protein
VVDVEVLRIDWEAADATEAVILGEHVGAAVRLAEAALQARSPSAQMVSGGCDPLVLVAAVAIPVALALALDVGGIPLAPVRRPLGRALARGSQRP